LLPSAGKVFQAEPQEESPCRLPYEQLPAFMKALRTGDSISRALEFTI
jgi:hypothetical protein